MSNVRGIIALNLSVAAQCSGARDEVCCAWQHIFYVGISAGSESLASPVMGQCGSAAPLAACVCTFLFRPTPVGSG